MFDAAELVFHGEVSPYVRQRTAVMSPLVLSALGTQRLAGKQILFVGTGQIAQCALAAYREYFPEMMHADFVNNGSEAAGFKAVATDLGIDLARGELQHIGKYDIIVCHSAANEPVLTVDMLPQVKQGAFIAAFASEDKVEVAENYYDSSQANILVDWSQTADEATELKAALDEGLAVQKELIELKDIFTKQKTIDTEKRYTIYRSHGTPMQNLAFLKLLMHT